VQWFYRFSPTVLVFAFAGLLFAQTGQEKNADKAAAQRASANPKRDTKAKLAVTPEREAAVMTFVQRNHAELTELLTHLKASRPAEYQRAVRDIFRTTERLALVQERDPEQYELEIALWTAQSRAQLLTAKLRMGSSEELEKELRAAVGVQMDARLSLLKHERQKIAERLAKMDVDISQLENDRESVINQQVDVLTRAARAGAKTGSKNAAKQGKKNTNP
jgi:hypothetical protein